MKKAFALVLMVALVMALAVPAYAAGSPTGSTGSLKPVASPTASPAADASVPTVATSTEFTIATTEEVATLAAEAQKTFADAKKELAAAAPAGMAAKYFFYLSTDKESVSVVFTVEGYTNVVVMQFVDGKWVEVEATMDANGNVTAAKMVDGPVAIFVK